MRTSRAAMSPSFHRRLNARTSHGKNLQLKSVPRYTDAQYARAVKSAGSYKYNPKKTTKSIQNAHIKNVAAIKAGDYGGSYVGMTVGAPGGFIGMSIAGGVGSYVGQSAARQVLQKQGIYIGPKQFLALSKDDQAAIVQRNRKIDRIDTVANIGMTAYSLHRAMRMTGTYGRIATKVSGKKAARVRASTHGLPRAGAGSRGFFAPKRAPRYGRNKGVYNITTMSGTRLR